ASRTWFSDVAAMLADDAVACPAAHDGDRHPTWNDDKSMLMTRNGVRRKHKTAMKCRVRIPRNRRVDVVLAVASKRSRTCLGAKCFTFCPILKHDEHGNDASDVDASASGFSKDRLATVLRKIEPAFVLDIRTFRGDLEKRPQFFGSRH